MTTIVPAPARAIRHALLQPSALILLAANLVPLIGVVVWHWDAFVLLILALVVSVILLFSLEQQNLLLQGFAQGKTVPTELIPALWQSRSDLIVVTLLIFGYALWYELTHRQEHAALTQALRTETQTLAAQTQALRETLRRSQP